MAILSRTSSESGFSVRQISTSGRMPSSRSLPTECCVGFVLISWLTRRYGMSVRWMNTAFCRPTSWPNWRIASRNGRPSMSPTVPPISVITTSTSGRAIRRMALLISLVMCGTTWIVRPRYSPRRSLEMTEL